MNRFVKKITLKNIAILLASGALLSACSSGNNGAKSAKTGWNYNDPKMGGFEVPRYVEQKNGPGLVLVEGGTFVMGATEQNITQEYDNTPRRVTVSSFYIDETEVANVHYREYVYWMARTFGATNPEVVRAALPDTTVWRRELAYNEPYVQTYFRHPAYNYYPVVGVSWKQANMYCNWRSDRVNEKLLIDAGFIKFNPNQVGQENFNTQSYMAGLYQPEIKNAKKSLDPNKQTRPINMEDGIMQPEYRLPTEAEWEYAALALVGNSAGENIEDRRIYPWSGHSLRNPKSGKVQGEMLANYRRGRGDLMGVAGKLNDQAAPTAPVVSYIPNDYGLYNMGGNVNEWVLDLYRPMTFQDMEDFNSFRGNEYTNYKVNPADNTFQRDSLGRLVRELDTKRYSNPSVQDFRDEVAQYDSTTTLVSNKSRVYKGGGWRDLPYWLSPGTRRFMDEDQARDDVGFRCAMIRVGSPQGKGKVKK